MEIRDLDFANDASAMLCTVVDKFNQGFISQNDRRYGVCVRTVASIELTKPWKICVTRIWFAVSVLNSCSTLLVRFAIKLLEDVVFFVADVINSGQQVLDVVMSKANRERQKLMREQNILKQVRPDNI